MEWDDSKWTRHLRGDMDWEDGEVNVDRKRGESKLGRGTEANTIYTFCSKSPVSPQRHCAYDVDGLSEFPHITYVVSSGFQYQTA